MWRETAIVGFRSKILPRSSMLVMVAAQPPLPFYYNISNHHSQKQSVSITQNIEIAMAHSTPSSRKTTDRTLCHRTPRHRSKRLLSTMTPASTPRLRRPRNQRTPSRTVHSVLITPSKNETYCHTGRRQLTPGGDRFIPDRNNVDLSRARHALAERAPKPLDDQRDDLPVKKNNEFACQLRRVLFEEGNSNITKNGAIGREHENGRSPSLMGIDRRRMFHKSSMVDPMSQDVLRSPWPEHQTSWSSSKLRSISTKRCFTLSMEGLNARDDLHVMTVGPQGLAVAMWDTVGFQNPNFDIPELQDMGNLTCLKWRSFDAVDTILAIGDSASIQIWDVGMGLRSTTITDHHTHAVAALEWMPDNPFEFFASTSSGLQFYDLRLRLPHVFTYSTNKSGIGMCPSASKLQIQPHSTSTLAAALPDQNTVALWDFRLSNRPLQTLKHDNVKGIEFCPIQRNTLASGGSDGVCLWNVQAGAVRSLVPTTMPVSTLTWSWDRREFMAGFGCYLAVYQGSADFTKVRKMEQWTQPMVGPVVAVERVHGEENRGRVVSLHCGSIDGEDTVICWEPFINKVRTKKMRSHREVPLGSLGCNPILR